MKIEEEESIKFYNFLSFSLNFSRASSLLEKDPTNIIFLEHALITGFVFYYVELVQAYIVGMIPKETL